LFNGAFQGFIAGPAEAHVELNLPLAALSTGIGLLGILIAWGFYGAHWFSAEAITRTFRPIHVLLVNRYYMDDIYGWLVRGLLLGLSGVFAWFDRHIVDGVVNGVAWLAYVLFGWILTRAESGRMPNYALGFFIGVLIIAGVVVGIPLGR
jgi:NADH-quinone oxidoreductase subunit L